MRFPRFPARALALAALASVLALSAPAAAQDGAAEDGMSEFDKMLLGLPYDRQSLLDEVQELEPGEAGGINEAIVRFETSNIALILPLDAPGYLGEVSNTFLEGFIQSAEAEGARFTLETYRTDGDPQSGLVAYRQAVRDGAGLVVGPLLRSSVERVAQLPAEFTVPTILLQEPEERIHAGQLGAPLLYSFPLGGEPEIVQFASELSRETGIREVFVLAENSPLGDRLVRTFENAWRLKGNPPAKVRRVVSEESWIGIHEELRASLEDEEEGGEATGLVPVYLAELRNVSVFAAGGPEFASQARANVPSALAVYVMAVIHSGLDRSGRNLLGLDGIRFFEMPYVLKQRGGEDQVASRYARELPVDLQRYLAAGIDSYRLASAFPLWGRLVLWRMDGSTGAVALDDGRFLREGVLLELADGVLVRVHPEPEPDPEEGAAGGEVPADAEAAELPCLPGDEGC